MMASTSAQKCRDPSFPPAGVLTYAAITFLEERLLDNRSAAARAVPLRLGLQKLHDSMCVTLRDAITATESNNASFLIIGDHGVGKTLVRCTLVERVLHTLDATHNKGTEKAMAVVRLAGVLHADERAAFQEVARQLCSESGVKFSPAASYDENLAFLRNMLKKLHMAMTTVVFVIDQFEHFTRSNKQLLLYNLMDALQHSGVQAVIIGVTTCYDVVESMEKRVKSRFSHCKLVVRPPTQLRASEDCAIGVLEQMLQLPSGIPNDAFATRHNAMLRSILNSPATEAVLLPIHHAIELRPHLMAGLALTTMMQWRVQLHAATAAAEPPAATRDVVATAVPSAAAAVAQGRIGGGMSSGGEVELHQKHLLAAAQQLQASLHVTEERIKDLSVLQLFLLVALVKLQLRKQPIANFKMAYSAYTGMAAPRESHNYSEAAALGAFQLLVEDTGLACYVDQKAEQRGRMLEYTGVQLRVDPEEVRRTVMSKQSSFPQLLQTFLNE